MTDEPAGINKPLAVGAVRIRVKVEGAGSDTGGQALAPQVRPQVVTAPDLGNDAENRARLRL
ncbi:MAG: hypothetical protein J2P27_14485 [Actinobacteria bacterium]|nr:hypothetical protein [Actinomycetota bacterium]